MGFGLGSYLMSRWIRERAPRVGTPTHDEDARASPHGLAYRSVAPTGNDHREVPPLPGGFRRDSSTQLERFPVGLSTRPRVVKPEPATDSARRLAACAALSPSPPLTPLSDP